MYTYLENNNEEMVNEMCDSFLQESGHGSNTNGNLLRTEQR